MILADFSQQVSQTNNNKNNDNHRHENNRIKNGNNTSNNNNNNTEQTDISIMNSEIMKVNERSINNYIEEMGIPGVGEAYYVKEQNRINELNRTIANARELHLQQSVDRLYSTGMMKKMNRTTISNNSNNNFYNSEKHQEQEQQEQEEYRENESKPPQPYYNQLYSQDSLFENEFRLHKLQTDCQLLYKKLFNNIFVKKYKIWLAFNEKDLREKEYKRMSLKESDYKAKCKVMLVEKVERMFVRSIVRFLVNHYELPSKNNSNSNSNYENNKNNNNTFISKEDEFIISYSDYLNHHNKLKEWIIKNSNNNINTSEEYTHETEQHIKSISHKLPFIYYLLNYNEFVKLDESKIRAVNDIEEWVMKWLRVNNRDNRDNRDKNKEESIFDWQHMYKVFENKLEQVQFTVPYETKLYQVKGNIDDKYKNGITKEELEENDEEEEFETFEPFKANPIPQSTYQKPSSVSQEQQFKKPPTQPIPFNFTQTNNHPQQELQEQYYSWNREFKAKPIPKTLYEPEIIGAFSTEKEKYESKKEHQEKLLKEANFPKTMNYLENYNEFQEEKKKELQQKYNNNPQNRLEERLRPKEVPDFGKIHKREMHMLETRKEINRAATTQPKPFKFAETKRAEMRSGYKHSLTNYEFYSHENNSNKNNNINKKARHLNQTTVTSPMPEAKSTAKFDAYVELRRQEKEERLKEQEYKQEMKKRQEQDKRRYKDILKERMHNELIMSQSKGVLQYNNNNNNNSNSNSMNNNINRVNLEEIYIERPLLMSSSSMNNNRKNNNDNTRTCFTDSYEPII